MKKLLLLLLCLCMLVPALAACKETPVSVRTGDPSSVTPVTPSPVTPTPSPDTPAPSVSDPTTPDPVTPTPETPTPTPVTPTPTDPTPWILHETPDAGMSYQNELLFLGDSTTAGMVAYKVLPDGADTKQVWSGKGNTITFMYYDSRTTKIIHPETGEEMVLKAAVALKKPKYLVITLGVSGGVSYLDEAGFKDVYRKILDDVISASPDTKIIIQSIYPVEASGYGSGSRKVTNEKIVVCNPYILDLAEEYYKAGKHVYFSDPYSVLIDENGCLKKEYGNGDGLHLCEKGFQTILRYLRTHALTLQ